MNAAIFGTKGFALIVDGEAVDVIDLDGRRGSAQATHVRRMLDEAADTCFIECDDLAEVRRRLQEAADAADALQLTLIALDSQLSSDTRREACDELTELFEVESTVKYVERVLYARPLGLEHDLHGAQELARSREVDAFFNRLGTVQSASVRVEAAWEQIPESMFVDASRRETFARFVNIGFVRDFVQFGGKLAMLLALNPRRRELDGDQDLLTQWLVLAQGLETPAASYDSRFNFPAGAPRGGEEMAAEDGISEGRAYKVEDFARRAPRRKPSH